MLRKSAYYLGIDVGSVSTNLVVIGEDEKLIEKLYIRTGGQPIKALKQAARLEIPIEEFGKYVLLSNDH